MKKFKLEIVCTIFEFSELTKVEFVIKTLVVKLSVASMERPPVGSLYTNSPSEKKNNGEEAQLINEDLFI